MKSPARTRTACPKARARTSDLLQFLSAFIVEIPPLRDRRADIALLAQRFLESRNFQRGIAKEFTPAALRAMESYSWPGNVRELGNVVERAIIMSHGARRIEPDHLNLPPGDDNARRNAGVTLRFDNLPTVDELREKYLAELTRRFNGNRRLIADAAGVSERNLYRMLGKRDDGPQ